MTRSDMLLQLSQILHDNFEIDPAQVTEDALLREDLDLDSIDAVDLLLSLKKQTGKKIKPDIFRSVKTVGDVVEALSQVMHEEA